MKSLDTAISILGGTANLARAIGVEPNVVSNWRKRGVPVEFCPEIERATGRQVLCEDLNDSVDWAYIRESAQSIADSQNDIGERIRSSDDAQNPVGGSNKNLKMAQEKAA